MQDLQKIALDIRRNIFRTVCNNRAGHLASSLSSVEIMVALYFGDVLSYDSKNPNLPKRDRFILSKGHAALALYYVLAKAGYYEESEVSSFCKAGTVFGGLATYGKIPGIETTTGSLGHGLSFAAGVAKIGLMDNIPYKVYTLLGDGEMQEGAVWEAVMFLANYELKNHILIVDNNGIQATGYSKDIINIGSLSDKLKAFGMDVIEVDGHDIEALVEALKRKTNKPKAIVANTVKGKGLSFVENKGDWHYKMPNEEEIEIGLKELGMAREELFA